MAMRVGEAECRAIRKLVRQTGESPPVRVVVDLLDEIDRLRVDLRCAGKPGRKSVGWRKRCSATR